MCDYRRVYIRASEGQAYALWSQLVEAKRVAVIVDSENGILYVYMRKNEIHPLVSDLSVLPS